MVYKSIYIFTAPHGTHKTEKLISGQILEEYLISRNKLFCEIKQPRSHNQGAGLFGLLFHFLVTFCHLIQAYLLNQRSLSEGAKLNNQSTNNFPNSAFHAIYNCCNIIIRNVSIHYGIHNRRKEHTRIKLILLAFQQFINSTDGAAAPFLRIFGKKFLHIAGNCQTNIGIYVDFADAAGNSTLELQ